MIFHHISFYHHVHLHFFISSQMKSSSGRISTNDECTLAGESLGLRSTTSATAHALTPVSTSDVSTILSDKETFEMYCSNSSNIKLEKVLTFQTFPLSTSLVSHGSTPVSPNPMGFGETVRRLLRNVHGHVNYHEQSLIILRQEGGTKLLSKDNLLLPDHIVSVLVIERTNSSQVYSVKDLDRFPHFSLLTSDLIEFQSALKLNGGCDISIMFVPSSVSYDNDDDGTHVVNHRGNNSSNELLSKIQKSFLKLIDYGVGGKFTLSDQGRGDVFQGQKEEASHGISLKERSIPTISFGYSSQDAKQYSKNRMSIVGNTRPEIRDGDLSPEAKLELYDLIITILSSEFGSRCFLRSGLNKEQLPVRKMLQCLLAQELKGDSDVDENNSRAEGGTLLVPERIAPHLDRGNSSVASLNDALIATCLLPTNVLKTEKTIVNNVTNNKKNIDLYSTLTSRGYKNKFPLAFSLYTRRNLDKVVPKMIMLKRMKEKDDLHSVFVWAITERMNSVVDYKGFIVDQTNFIDFFNDRAAIEQEDQKKKKKPMKAYDTINLPYFKVPAAYDRMGFWSIIYDLFLTLSVCILEKPKVKDTIDFIIYCACCCNGTSVPWRVVNTIMMDPKVSRSKLKSVFKGDFFKFLVNMDLETAKDQYLESQKTGDDTGLRSRGNCQWNRFVYSMHSATITVSQEFRQMILEQINDPYGSPIKKKRGVKRGSKKKIVDETPYGKMITLLSSLDGIGNFLAQNAMNLFSLFGLTPLSWYFDASIPEWKSNLGPVKLLKRVYANWPMMKKTPADIYRDIHDQFNTIFPGKKVTMNILESAGCEVERCVALTVSALTQDEEDDEYRITCIENDMVRVESRKYDVYFWMKYREAPQNLFTVETSRPGVSQGDPAIFIRDVTSCNKSLRYVTNWKGQSSENDTNFNHIHWNKDKSVCFELDTTLSISSDIYNLYKSVDMSAKSEISPNNKVRRKSIGSITSPPKTKRTSNHVSPSSSSSQRSDEKRRVIQTSFYATYGKNVCHMSGDDSDYIDE